MKPIRVAISGAHSQGKSTLVSDLMLTPEFRNFSALTNMTRAVQAKGIGINELGGDWSQALIIAKHIERQLSPGNLLFDRFILDGIVYTRALYEQGKVGPQTLNYASWVYDQLIKDPTVLLFYVEPELPLADDSVRSVKREFFDEIVRWFNYYIKTSNLDPIRLRGSREERVKTVIDHVNHFKH